MKEQLDLASNLSRQSLAAAESYLIDLHKAFAVVAAKMGDLVSANAMLLEELETSSSTHAKLKTELAMDVD